MQDSIPTPRGPDAAARSCVGVRNRSSPLAGPSGVSQVASNSFRRAERRPPTLPPRPFRHPTSIEAPARSSTPTSGATLPCPRMPRPGPLIASPHPARIPEVADSVLIWHPSEWGRELPACALPLPFPSYDSDPGSVVQRRGGGVCRFEAIRGEGSSGETRIPGR